MRQPEHAPHKDDLELERTLKTYHQDIDAGPVPVSARQPA